MLDRAPPRVARDASVRPPQSGPRGRRRPRPAARIPPPAAARAPWAASGPCVRRTCIGAQPVTGPDDRAAGSRAPRDPKSVPPPGRRLRSRQSHGPSGFGPGRPEEAAARRGGRQAHRRAVRHSPAATQVRSWRGGPVVRARPRSRWSRAATGRKMASSAPSRGPGLTRGVRLAQKLDRGPRDRADATGGEREGGTDRAASRPAREPGRPSSPDRSGSGSPIRSVRSTAQSSATSPARGRRARKPRACGEGSARGTAAAPRVCGWHGGYPDPARSSDGRAASCRSSPPRTPRPRSEGSPFVTGRPRRLPGRGWTRGRGPTARPGHRSQLRRPSVAERRISRAARPRRRRSERKPGRGLCSEPAPRRERGCCSRSFKADVADFPMHSGERPWRRAARTTGSGAIGVTRAPFSKVSGATGAVRSPPR